MSQSHDWRTMDAGPKLDRLIAERLGWTDVRILDELAMSKESRLFSGPPPYSQARLYGIMPSEGFLRDERYLDRIQGYSTDANAALALFDTSMPIPVLRQQLVGKSYCAALLQGVSAAGTRWEMRPDTYVEAPSPALAICRLWLAWQDAAQGQQAKITFNGEDVK